eukprot:2239375-Alexandrium_andersonii.AAC.1
MQNLRSGAWPADVVASEQINDLRCPIYREVTLNVLSPGFVHGVALACLAKQDTSTTLRIFGPLG